MDDLQISNLSLTMTVQGEVITKELPKTILLSELNEWIEYLQKLIYTAAITIPERRTSPTKPKFSMGVRTKTGTRYDTNITSTHNKQSKDKV